MANGDHFFDTCAGKYHFQCAQIFTLIGAQGHGGLQRLITYIGNFQVVGAGLQAFENKLAAFITLNTGAGFHNGHRCTG